MIQNKKVLISGASFAGLTTAFWMNKMGYIVTIVEIGSHLKMGGTPVDIKDSTVDTIKRMGLFEQIKAERLQLGKIEFKDAHDITQNSMLLKQTGQDLSDDAFEIERDTLLKMQYNLVKDNVHFVYNNSISDLQEHETHVEVTFKDGSKDNFELVFGCDGIHSSVRRICFGNESEYSHFLGYYFSIAVVNKLLIAESTMQLYAEPKKSFMLNTYNGKTDIVFIFSSAKEIEYDYRNQEQVKQITYEKMEGMKWRANELREELLTSKSFYFDKLCQIKMPSWTKGRVALVGDAGYCASPAAGMGGSLAIIGATALADAFEKHNGDYQLAFQDYNNSLRPYVENVQANAVETIDSFIPNTEEDVQYRLHNGFPIQ